MGSENPKSESLTSILDDAESRTGGETVSIGEILDSVSQRGFGPLLLLPALLSISPAGAIPGMSFVTGALIVLIAFQMLFGAEHPWIPAKLEQVSIAHAKFERGISKTKPWATLVNAWIRERWTALLESPWKFLTPLVMLLLAVCYFPLALVPMGVFLPGFANTMFALGLTCRDGLLIAVGHLCTLLSIIVVALSWPY